MQYIPIGEDPVEIVILGNGVTGVSAALRIRREQPDWRITLISGESTYHYSRPALMYIFMGHMSYQDTKPYEDAFWREQRLELRRGWVVGIDFDRRRLELSDGEGVGYDRLLLATGAKPNRFHWPGQDLEGVQGFYGLEDLRTLIENSRRARQAVVVGGGLIGIELAEMLHSRGIHVSILVREDHYWGNVLPREEAELIQRRIRARGIDLRVRTQLAEVLDDGHGRACAAMTDQGDRLECQIVGLTAGVSPNLDLVRETRLKTDRGIVVDAAFRTSEAEVYAAGDCAQLADGRVQQVWYTGREQGEAAGAAMSGRDIRFEPGVWFNSAKFFDLEFQVYGEVPADASAENSFYWQHARDDAALRIAHRHGVVTGFHFFGMRARHRVCERWIRDGATLDTVMRELSSLHFDGEFAPVHREAIRRHYTGAA